MASEGNTISTEAPPAFNKNATVEPPPPFKENPNLSDPTKKNEISLNNHSHRLLIFSVMLFAVIIFNFTIWGFMMRQGNGYNSTTGTWTGYCDIDSSWWSSSYSPDVPECDWLKSKIAAYALGLAGVMFPFAIYYVNILPEFSFFNIIGGILLILSGIIAMVAQILMVNQYEFSSYIYCPLPDDTDSTSWWSSSSGIEFEEKCCWCEPAASISYYVFLSVFTGVDMIGKIGNNPIIRVVFYGFTIIFTNLLWSISYFDEIRYSVYVQDEPLFQLNKSSLIIMMLLSVIMIIFAFIAGGKLLYNAVIKKILAILLVIFSLHIVMYQNSYGYGLYLWLLGDSGPFLFMMLVLVIAFDLVTRKSKTKI